MLNTMKNICEFIINTKGYYIYPKEFQDNKKVQNLILDFYKRYPQYNSNIKIIILPYNNNNLKLTCYKLFFISSYSYNMIKKEINSINDNLQDNMYYYSKILDLDFLPISFIKSLLNTNMQLLYKDNTLQLISINELS